MQIMMGSIIVWLHVFVGIIWIGLLYYFNFVQVPAVAEAAGDKDGPGPAAINRYVAPRRAGVVSLCGAADVADRRRRARDRVARRRRPQRCFSARRKFANHRRRRVARHDHAVQRVGADLAEPEENSGAGRRRGERRGKSQSQENRADGVAHQHAAVHPDADVHGRRRHGPRPAILSTAALCALSLSLSLWERAGVRAACLTWHPHPACGHLLPEGEGLVERRLKDAFYSLSPKGREVQGAHSSDDSRLLATISR